jgi:hypothetical protein
LPQDGVPINRVEGIPHIDLEQDPGLVRVDVGKALHSHAQELSCTANADTTLPRGEGAD